ncbi:MAG: PIN domain-containing protein [Aquificae bacterium]|nr:PIN domain-containing protein [Aquificota bacterium]
MKLLDALVLLEFLSGEEEKAERIKAFLDELEQKNERLFVPEEVVIELVYFLEHGYGWEREEVARLVERLLSDELFTVELKPFVEEALKLYGQGKGTFLDCLKAVKARRAGIKEVVTLNERMSKLGLKVINPLKREA